MACRKHNVDVIDLKPASSGNLDPGLAKLNVAALSVCVGLKDLSPRDARYVLRRAGFLYEELVTPFEDEIETSPAEPVEPASPVVIAFVICALSGFIAGVALSMTTLLVTRLA